MLNTGKDIHKNKRLKSLANESFMDKKDVWSIVAVNTSNSKNPIYFF